MSFISLSLSIIVDLFATKIGGYTFMPLSHGEDDRCLLDALLVGYLLQMFVGYLLQTSHYESNHCFPRWMCSSCDGYWFSFLRVQNAADDNPRPNILQLNTEGLTANKISVLEQLLAYNNKAFIIVLKETRTTSADKLVIPNFLLAASVLSRNHGLATFVHERLQWSLIDQSPTNCLSWCRYIRDFDGTTQCWKQRFRIVGSDSL